MRVISRVSRPFAFFVVQTLLTPISMPTPLSHPLTTRESCPLPNPHPGLTITCNQEISPMRLAIEAALIIRGSGGFHPPVGSVGASASPQNTSPPLHAVEQPEVGVVFCLHELERQRIEHTAHR